MRQAHLDWQWVTYQSWVLKFLGIERYALNVTEKTISTEETCELSELISEADRLTQPKLTTVTSAAMFYSCLFLQCYLS